MTVSVIDSYRKTDQAINTPEGVAQYIVGLEIKPELNGKAIYGKPRVVTESAQDS
jgi:hypothetical protein